MEVGLGAGEAGSNCPQVDVGERGDRGDEAPPSSDGFAAKARFLANEDQIDPYYLVLYYCPMIRFDSVVGNYPWI